MSNTSTILGLRRLIADVQKRKKRASADDEELLVVIAGLFSAITLKAFLTREVKADHGAAARCLIG